MGYYYKSSDKFSDEDSNKKHFKDVYDHLFKTHKIKLNSIVENMSDALFIFYRDGRMLSLNKKAREYSTYFMGTQTIHEVYSLITYSDLEDNIIPFEELPSSLVLSGKTVIDMHIKLKNGLKEEYISANATPVYSDDGNFQYGIVSYRDISMNITSNKMKDEFQSLISHEFKTPITVINSAIQAMETICSNELTHKAKGFLSKIKKNNNRQLKLVNNLLDITKINSGYLKNNKANLDIVSLTWSVTESIKIYAEQKGIKLSFCSTLEKKVIGIDEEKLERIMLNLLSNAVKFTPRGKHIKVKVFQKKIKSKFMVCIQVTDQGIGIHPDKQDVIFERFGQVDSFLNRKAEGTGIGLYLVKKLVEIIDGEISIESMEGEGSTFTVLLPSTKVKNTTLDNNILYPPDKRIIHTTDIEFSDIYM